MAEHAEDLGKYLKKAVEHYNSMFGSIETVYWLQPENLRHLVSSAPKIARNYPNHGDCSRAPQRQLEVRRILFTVTIRS